MSFITSGPDFCNIIASILIFYYSNFDKDHCKKFHRAQCSDNYMYTMFFLKNKEIFSGN